MGSFRTLSPGESISSNPERPLGGDAGRSQVIIVVSAKLPHGIFELDAISDPTCSSQVEMTIFSSVTSPQEHTGSEALVMLHLPLNRPSPVRLG